MEERIFIGVAWPYVNGDIHVGHLAGYLLPADICSRFYRLSGKDVLMVSGSDCHGTPTTIYADENNITPSDVVDRFHPERLRLIRKYALEYSIFTKTTTKNHKDTVQQIFLDLLKNGYIEKGVCDQYYSEEENKFLPDRYVEGECPYCHAKEQRSDQCEKCGRMLSQGELINPTSKISGKSVVIKKSEQYMLLLDKLQPQIKKYISLSEGKYKKWVQSESIGWLNEGLRKRPITRDLNWGVDIPCNRIDSKFLLKDCSNKKFYVWFEAVIGYLSGAIEWSKRKKGDSDTIYRIDKGQNTDYNEWFHNKHSVHYYFMGQDNLVFHTIMWPGILLGSQRGYILPDYVSVNKFYNYEGKKFSKSRNWIIDSIDIAEKYGEDLVRYYLCRTFPENKQGNFQWDAFFSTVNNELSSKLSNYVYRTLSFIEKNCDSKISKDVVEKSVRKKIVETFNNTSSLLTGCKQLQALDEVFRLVDFANRYFDKTQVWEVYKPDKKRANEILWNCLVILWNLRILMNPFVPGFSRKLSKQLNAKQLVYEVGLNYWTYTVPSCKGNSYEICKDVKPIYMKTEKVENLSKI